MLNFDRRLVPGTLLETSVPGHFWNDCALSISASSDSPTGEITAFAERKLVMVLAATRHHDYRQHVMMCMVDGRPMYTWESIVSGFSIA